MKKTIVAVFLISITTGVYAADMQQQDASVGLSVPQIIELVGLDMTETVMPGPEDYARDLMLCRVVNAKNTAGAAAVSNAMGYDAVNCTVPAGKGFAERTDAISLSIFTNAQDGAALYVHGTQPQGPQGILQLEDSYVSVCTEKTYILQNDLEGAYAGACSVAYMEKEGLMANSSIDRVKDNPRNDMGGIDVYTTSGAGASLTEKGQLTQDVTETAESTWLRLHNQAQHLFEVKMATKAPRLIVINLGIANLARYTEGEYTNTLTFTLMPIVG
ncbi:MAG: hypothetical protein QME49_09180 [bacterium]|nr:hypothetical protein [bacterium]